MNKTLSNILLSGASIALLYAAIFYIDFLAWVAIAPLILLAHNNNFKQAVCPAALVALGTGWLMSAWLWDYKISSFLVALFYVTAYYYLFIILLNLFFKRIKYPFSILAPSFFWMLLFFVFSLNPIGNHPFNYAIKQPLFAPLAEIIKGPGILFLVILFNSVLAFIIIKRSKALAAVLILMAVLFGACYYYSYTREPVGERFRVALIQGNFFQDWEWRVERSSDEIFERYRKLTLSVLQEKPDLVVWPEYAFADDILLDKDLYGKIHNFTKEINTHLILGSRINLKPEERIGKLLFYNTAFVFGPDGQQLGAYRAVKPIPFEDIKAGEDFPIFDIKGRKVGITICNDELFSSIYRVYEKRGADFFVSISNNATMGDKKAINSLKEHSRMRAAEYGKYLLRATNTGITMAINPYGKIVSRLEPDQEGVLVVDIYLE